MACGVNNAVMRFHLLKGSVEQVEAEGGPRMDGEVGGNGSSVLCKGSAEEFHRSCHRARLAGPPRSGGRASPLLRSRGAWL